jgi:hypothetical protein
VKAGGNQNTAVSTSNPTDNDIKHHAIIRKLLDAIFKHKKKTVALAR